MELTIVQDKNDLERLEGVIQKNLNSFYKMGMALMEIQDRELYKIKNGGVYATFEAYCKSVWDFRRAHAYRLINSAKVIETLSPVGDIKLATESQLRPLTKLEPEKQRVAWQKVVETAPEGKITANHVSKIVKEMTEPAKPKVPSSPRPIMPADAMHLAMTAISHLKRINDDDPTREEALDMILEWVNKHRGLIDSDFSDVSDTDFSVENKTVRVSAGP